MHYNIVVCCFIWHVYVENARSPKNSKMMILFSLINPIIKVKMIIIIGVKNAAGDPVLRLILIVVPLSGLDWILLSFF